MLPKFGFCITFAILSIAVCYGAQQQQPQNVQHDKAQLEQFQLQQQLLLLQKQHLKHQQQKQKQHDQPSKTTVKITTDTSKRHHPPFLPPPPFPPFGPSFPPFLPPPILPPRPPPRPPPTTTPPQFPFPFCIENPTNQFCKAWLCSVFPTNPGCTPVTPPPPPPPPPPTGIDIVEFCRQNPWVCQLLARQDWFCRAFPLLSVCPTGPVTPQPPDDIIGTICRTWPWVCQPPADWCQVNVDPRCPPVVPGQPGERIIDWICKQTAAADFRLCPSKDNFCAVASQLWLCQPSTRISEYITEICATVPLVCPNRIDQYSPDDSTATATAEEACRQYPWICSSMASQSELNQGGREFNITIPLDLLLQNSNVAIPNELLQQNLNIAVPAEFLIGDSTAFGAIGEEKEAAYKPVEFKRPLKRTKLVQARRRQHRFW